MQYALEARLSGRFIESRMPRTAYGSRAFATILFMCGGALTMVLALDPQLAINRHEPLFIYGLITMALSLIPYCIYILSDQWRVISDRRSYIFIASKKGKWFIEMPIVRSYAIEANAMQIHTDTKSIEIEADAELLLVIRYYLIAYDCMHGGSRPNLSTDLSSLNHRTMAGKQ